MDVVNWNVISECSFSESIWVYADPVKFLDLGMKDLFYWISRAQQLAYFVFVLSLRGCIWFSLLRM